MPTYHLHNGPNLDGDPASIELPSPDAACMEICRYTADRLREAGTAVFDRELRTVVTDENGMVLYTVFVVGVESPAAQSLRGKAPMPRAAWA
jgi:hypothetical protein